LYANCGDRYHIALVEAARFYEFFVGLPVRERDWGFKRPDLDEL
jgi:hypothetical protein